MNTNYRKPSRKYQPLSSLSILPGNQIFSSNINITNKKRLVHFNLVTDWKRKYKNQLDLNILIKSLIGRENTKIS